MMTRIVVAICLLFSAVSVNAFAFTSSNRDALVATSSFAPSLLGKSGGSRLYFSLIKKREEDSFIYSARAIAHAVSSLRGETIVVKYGGNAMTSPELARGFCEDVATLSKLGIRIVVVHGGGPQINKMLDAVGVQSRFEGSGMRVSSPEVVDVAEMVLCGSVNKKIANGICASGGRAIGISGRDDNLLQCTKLVEQNGLDLGNVGKVEIVNTDLLHDLLNIGLTPVVSPIGTGMGESSTVAYNCNADVAAGRIAGELRATRVIFLTDIAGVLDTHKKLLRELSIVDVNDLIADGTISGGMIPKVKYATGAIQLGVTGAYITDGRVPHALLKEVLYSGGDNTGMGTGQGGTFIHL